MNSHKDTKDIDVYSPIPNGVMYHVHHMEYTCITIEAHRLNFYAICLLSEPVLRTLESRFGSQVKISYNMGGLVKDITSFYDNYNDIGGDPDFKPALTQEQQVGKMIDQVIAWSSALKTLLAE